MQALHVLCVQHGCMLWMQLLTQPAGRQEVNDLATADAHALTPEPVWCLAAARVCPH